MHGMLTQAIAQSCDANGREYDIVDTVIPGG
jgi:hypothetical protein